MSGTKTPARPHTPKKAAGGSFLGDILREIAARTDDDTPDSELQQNARLLDAADREALMVMATEGTLYDLANANLVDDYDSAFERLGCLQDPAFDAFGQKLDAIEPEIRFDGAPLSDAVLAHRIAATRAGFLLGVSIGRRIGGGK